MARIIVDPTEERGVSSKFTSTQGEMQGLVSKARSMMSNLQANWKGQRANTTFTEWQNLQKNLDTAIQTLERASVVLKSAADEFASVDGQ